MNAFECKMCGTCCYGEGGIYVENDDIRRIANFMGITPESFVADYCEERHARIYIRTGEKGFCTFYDQKKHCLIHHVKPLPCTVWPFYPAILKEKENWEMAKEACPGINPECDFEEFVRQSKPSGRAAPERSGEARGK